MTLHADRRGTALIEMALLLPLLLMLLMGSLVYGQYFHLAHDVQRAANDAVRAALAGVDAQDRRLIATRTVQRNLAGRADHARNQTQIAVSESGGIVAVRVSVTLPADSFLATALVPVPNSVITADAAAELQPE